MKFTAPRETLPRNSSEIVLRHRQLADAATLGAVGLSRIIVACLMISSAGCTNLFSVGGRIAAGNSPKSTSARDFPESSDQTSSFGPLATLHINKESIEAADLWIGAHDELAEVAQRVGRAEYEDYVKRRAETLVRDRISESLLYQQASLRIPADAFKQLDRIIDAELRKIITLEHGGVERRFVKNLESQGSSMEQRRESMRRQLVIASYFDNEIKPKLGEPTRAQLVQAFQDQAMQQRRPERRSMSLIDVRIQTNGEPLGQDAQPGPRASPQERIRTAQAALADGRSFDSVAREFSDGLNAQDGGSWGPVTPEAVREPFLPAVDALFKLEAQQVSGIVATDTHFFIVRCDEIDRPIELDFETAQPGLREKHFRVQYNRLVAERINELRANARIDPSEIERFFVAVLRAGPGWSDDESAGQP